MIFIFMCLYIKYFIICRLLWKLVNKNRKNVKVTIYINESYFIQHVAERVKNNYLIVKNRDYLENNSEKSCY